MGQRHQQQVGSFMDDFVSRAVYQPDAIGQLQGHLYGHNIAKPVTGSRNGKEYEDPVEGSFSPSVTRGLGGTSSSLPQRRRQPSNLESLVVNTTPAVTFQHLSKTKSWRALAGTVRSLNASDTETVPYFSLSDVWDAYEEWSVYGCGVPLVLANEENAVQYYVPYLSAIQLFTRSSLRRLEAVRRSEEGDACDSEYKDSCSETSDSDGERSFPFAGSDSSSEPGSDAMSLEEDADAPGHVWGRQCLDCRDNHSVFEYFEKAAPYGRVPLTDKITELGKVFPGIKSLRSIDLHPASWFSVAWYPVYRIPTGPTLRDLAASFLTYHSLSTPLCTAERCGNCSKSFWIATLSAPHCQPNTPKVQGSCQPSKKQQMRIPPFGLSTYKSKGAVWSQQGWQNERKRMNQLQVHADKWLQQQKIHHPDFDFFRSYSSRG